MFKRFFRAIKNFFTGGSESTPSTGYGERPALPFKVLKKAFIIGHNKTARGAEVPYHLRELGKFEGLYTEYEYNLAAAKKADLVFTTRNLGGMSLAAKEAADISKEVSIELHLNAYNSNAKGFEILYLAGDYEAEAVANQFLLELENHFPTHTNRGLKAIGRGGRGYKNLKLVRNAGVRFPFILEGFFIDNPRDYIPLEDYAEFLAAL